ncbi:DUF1461 domain-containing protein [Candidatus Woesearchaeota archaeon]|nr:DUF1461 domain-containing protein [Candidatus Woesearchaeota archaeon]HIH26080.1 DUF1461 domain-containing protein [Nanoarchaeota archaeon]
MKKIYFTILLIPIFILLLSFKVFVYDENSYKQQFRENNIYTKYNESYVNNISSNLINYFKDKEELKDYYTYRERIHLEDVKKLINNALKLFYIIFIALLIIFSYLIQKKDYKILSRILKYGGILNLIIYFIIFIISLINFEKFFIKFHQILFTNDYWILNPTDILVNVFTQEFFISILRKIMTTSIILSLLFILAGIFIEKAYKHRTL